MEVKICSEIELCKCQKEEIAGKRKENILAGSPKNMIVKIICSEGISVSLSCFRILFPN